MSTTTSKIVEQVLQTPIDTVDGTTHLKIMAGLLSGLIAAVILICFILYAFKKFKSPTNRNRALSEHEDYTDNRIAFEATSNKNETSAERAANCNNNNNDAMKRGCKILIVYTYDCEQHFNVIKAFANFLREVCRLTVYFDFWEEEEIKLAGVEAWLDRNLESADYVLTVWSIGARIKCSSKLNHASNSQNFNFLDENGENLNFSKLINDSLFNYSINYILKSTRQHNQLLQEDGNDKYLNIYFDYSNKNDISYKFDAFKQYRLMLDFKKFLQHIYLNQSFLIISNYLGIYITDESIGEYNSSGGIVRLRESGARSSTSKKSKKGSKFRDNTPATTALLLDQSATSSMTSAQFNENLISLKKIYIDQLYKQIANTQSYFKQNPSWFENSLFQQQSSNNVNNNNNSTLTLDSSLVNLGTATMTKHQTSTNNNNKLISFSSSSSSIAGGADTVTVPTVSSSSLISLGSIGANNNNTTSYNDYFVHPLPTCIDSNYFSMIEERLKNNSKNNNNNEYFYNKSKDFSLISS